MLTAKTAGVFKEDGVAASDPFDRGSGRIRPTQADDPGLSISDTGANFVALQANLSLANYPSLYVPRHPGIVTVNRTVRSELVEDAIWTVTASAPDDVKVTVSPKEFPLAAGASATVSITVDASAVPVGEVRFAKLRFRCGDQIVEFPISLVRRDTPLTFAKVCTPSTFPRGANTQCSITLTNTSFDTSPLTLTDMLPPQLRLLSVSGATMVDARNLSFVGTIAGAEPPNVTIAAGDSPAGGYLPLSLFGVAPIGGVTDDTIINFNVPPFSFGAETWTQLGVGSNGYLVVGGGSGPDVTVVNQNFPNPTRPNNVLAPFWTDLNPAAGGALRIATLTDGVDTWLVVDWAAVRNFSSATTQSFEVWIGLNGDGNPGEDITFAYGPVGGGDLGFLTVGAENRFGNRGQSRFFNGAGTAPVNGTQLRITSAAGTPGETKVINFTARGHSAGAWTNCARATAPAIFFGTATACTTGEVTP